LVVVTINKIRLIVRERGPTLRKGKGLRKEKRRGPHILLLVLLDD